MSLLKIIQVFIFVIKSFYAKVSIHRTVEWTRRGGLKENRGSEVEPRANMLCLC